LRFIHRIDSACGFERVTSSSASCVEVRQQTLPACQHTIMENAATPSFTRAAESAPEHPLHAMLEVLGEAALLCASEAAQVSAAGDGE
jgi:hypothetical protein